MVNQWQQQLRNVANPQKVKILSSFFKTGKENMEKVIFSSESLCPTTVGLPDNIATPQLK